MRRSSSPPRLRPLIQQVQQEIRVTNLPPSIAPCRVIADVEILPKAKGLKINSLPLPPQPEPANLLALKLEITKRWPMTSLLDVLKETDLRVDFTRFFRSPTPWENLDRATLQYRLLLALYGLGTGAGLKAGCRGQPGARLKRSPLHPAAFYHPDAVRQSIAAVVNRLSLLLDSGVFGSTVVRESQRICQAILKKKGFKEERVIQVGVARQRYTHDPGIQPEPGRIVASTRPSRPSRRIL